MPISTKHYLFSLAEVTRTSHLVLRELEVLSLPPGWEIVWLSPQVRHYPHEQCCFVFGSVPLDVILVLHLSRMIVRHYPHDLVLRANFRRRRICFGLGTIVAHVPYVTVGILRLDVVPHL